MPPNRTKRCFPNSGPILSVKLEDEIIRKLTLLVTKYNPEIHHYPKRECLGLYAGPTSVAYVFFYFAQSSKYKDTIVEGKKCAVWSQLYLDAANRVAVSDEILSEEDATHGGLIDGQETNSMHCGIINDELARAAVCAVLTKDSKYSDILLGYLSKILDGGSKYDEVVYGRTGYLLFLRLVNHYMPDTIPKTAYKQVIDVILSHPPWLFYGSLPYLGVGHGWAGIFLEIVLCDPSYAQQVQPYIEQMLDQQLESKNWPSNIHSSPPDGTENSERKDDDILVQWVKSYNFLR